MLRIRHLGGPTVLLELAGLRLLTDPTFDPPGDYPIGARRLTKTAAPAVPRQEVGRLDAVLLSHDQHPDNLDREGRLLLAEVPLVLTTPAAAERLGGSARALRPWEAVELPGAPGALRVTAVPALHGPPGSEPLVGPVTGFLLAGPGVTTVYVSGDNASLDLVREIAARSGPPEVAVLFAGGARTALLDAFLTLSSADTVEAIRILGARDGVVVHLEGWAHFSEGPDSLRRALEGASLASRVHLAEPGQELVLGA